ncbi:hypothetical protein [Azospirillum sp. TSH64]|uniref:pPIWI_RE_Z domain-containing protein n=1 Tax=Azospirillum sp. TSH64 TaxID=652740 RepID=UPI00130502E3|nr:hypothetical protein [Azospirillum sp. TSH64]
MRTDRTFVAEYRDALASIDPTCGGLDREAIRTMAATELSLLFLTEFLSGEGASAVPSLMLGYPQLLDELRTQRAVQALATVRHLCSRFISLSAWLDARLRYTTISEALRCFDVLDGRVTLRATAPGTTRVVLEAWLSKPVPWVSRTLNVADPGEAQVLVGRGSATLAYDIPAVPAERRVVQQHDLTPRRTNQPIRVRIADLLAVAATVDEREAAADWPHESMPPLNMVERIRKLRIQGLLDGFYEDGVITLDGTTHLVGMLSSGKSSLVMALLLGLTLGSTGKRIAVLVPDTIHGAKLSARLRRHGVKATVLSSLRQRPRHLNGIHWQRSLDATGWSLASLGDLSDGFGTACPLDGFQREPQVVRGSQAEARFPDFDEKQCHRLYQKAVPDEDAEDKDPDDIGESKGRSCPLWACCPAQEQQRSAVDAQVLIMTPQAFIHMTPDVWTTSERITIPELLQFTTDLVIIDEVDGVQKVLDDIFAPRSPIMGDEQDVYAPSIGQRSSAALRARSGAQFRKSVNAKWQNNFFTFFRLVGIIYALLQNEQESLWRFYRNTPFTAASILYELWRRHLSVSGVSTAEMRLDYAENEQQFLEVLKVATAISRFSHASSVSTDEADEAAVRDLATFRDERFRVATETLQAIARDVLVADYYDEIDQRIEALLDGALAVFSAVSKTGPARDRLDRRANALAILLAVVTELALSHYNWLIKTQPAVASDLDIDDTQLLSQANSLIKHYRTLLPSNPAGAVFGLFYNEPDDDRQGTLGGKLTLINHLGVGRHLIAHLHNLLGDEGQAGPHVLLLSGTSWAGGGVHSFDPKTKKPISVASPSFDVQVPVRGVLLQPDAELDAISQSVFSLVNVRDGDGRQIRVSGVEQQRRRENLSFISERLVSRRDGINMLENHWCVMTGRWGEEAIADRRRAMLVVNSYADAAVVADTVMQTLEANGYADWRVYCLVRDRADDAGQADDAKLRLARPMPRSMVERFGLEPEKSILVAPMQIVARGHNILNGRDKAAIASIYFLHRPHPRPDDLGPVIARLNRYALERYDKGVAPLPGESLPRRSNRMRQAAASVAQMALERTRYGYSNMSAEYKAQFAWDMLTPLWQTVGRGIRGGCPVFIGFVDYKFAPQSFDGNPDGDTADTSALVQCIKQLDLAMDPTSNPTGHDVARRLYEPFHDALSKTEGLQS